MDWITRLLHARRPGATPRLGVLLVASPCPGTDDLALSLRRLRPLRVRVSPPRGGLAHRLHRLHGRPDVVLIDQGLGVERAIGAATALRGRHPGVPVIVLGELGGPGASAQVILRSGAAGFVDKRGGVEAIGREILAVLGSSRDRSARVVPVPRP